MDYQLILILTIFLFGFIVTGESMPFFSRMAHRHDILAYPGGRKIHEDPTPLLGAAAIFFPFICIFWPFFALVKLGYIVLAVPSTPQMLSLFFGAFWIFVLGVIDDKFGLKWKQKLVGQVLGVLILISGGHTVHTATLPLLGAVDFGLLGPIVFGLGILAITNAINLVDGLDGLAGGICFFAALTSGIIGYVKGDIFTAVIAFTFSGALLGFLRHNFPPAAVYMGDGGSLLLGFVLGTLATSSAAAFPGQRAGTMGMLIAPFLPFGIALLDVLLAIGRRWVSGRKIFWADSDHIHHRLMDKFRHPRRVVAILYSFSALLSALTLCLTLGPNHAAIRVFVVTSSFILVVVVVLLLRLYRNESILRTWGNRPHFKYLGHFNSFMAQRISRAATVSEVISLFGRGVEDLEFHSVEIYLDGKLDRKWNNARPIHGDRRPSRHERTLRRYGMTIKWVSPVHDSVTYQKSLDIAWHRYITQIETRLTHLTKDAVKSPINLTERLSEPSAKIH